MIRNRKDDEADAPTAGRPKTAGKVPPKDEEATPASPASPAASDFRDEARTLTVTDRSIDTRPFPTIPEDDTA